MKKIKDEDEEDGVRETMDNNYNMRKIYMQQHRG